MKNSPVDRLIRSISEKAWRCLAPATALILACAAPAAAAVPPERVHLVAGMDASSRWDQSPRVGFAIELHNSGPGSAANVQVRDIRIVGGKLVSKPPISVGSIGGDQSGVVHFIADVPQRNGKVPIQIRGTYDSGRGARTFVVTKPVSVDRPPDRPISVQKGTTRIQRPQDVRYPPKPATPPSRERPNAETPMLIPPGPPRRVSEPTRKGTALATAGGSISIPVNATDRNGAGVPPDPSGASAAVGGVVLTTYNTGIAVSTNGGATFTDYNLLAAVPGQPGRTTFFPQSEGGLCCDQVVIYVPRANLFFWLLQYNPTVSCIASCTPPGPPTNGITQPGRIRIAWATPRQIISNFYNAWTYADLTAPQLGAANNEWLDYPDLAYSGRFLYVGVDRGWPNGFGSVYSGRRLVARMSMADILNTAATSVGYNSAELTGSNGLNKTHFIQNAPGRMVVGSLDNTSTLRVFTWDDGSAGVAAPATVGISSITNTYNSALADGTDWVNVGFPGNITGGTYRRRAMFQAPSAEDYMFAFTAGINGAGRPRPYVRLETVRPVGASGYAVSEEYDIFHPDYAYAVAGLGSGSDIVTPEIGLSLFVGGGTIGYPQGVVGFKNDFVVYSVTGANAAQGVRFGDYVNARPIPGTTTRFGTQTYEVLLPAGSPSGSTCATVGCTARMRYIEFERPPLPPIH